MVIKTAIARRTVIAYEIRSPDSAGSKKTNELRSVKSIGQDFISIRLYYSGLAIWTPPDLLTTSCLVDVSYFPFDAQTCVLQFVSFGTLPSEVDLHSMVIKTAIARRTVIAYEIRSPDSAGSKKTNELRSVRKRTGNIMFTRKNTGRRFIVIYTSNIDPASKL
jgi:hypothetical protein